MNENPVDKDELGALWERTGEKGPYMTGVINGQRVVVFKNNHKTGTQPDWRVKKAIKKEDRPARPNDRSTDGDVGF